MRKRAESTLGNDDPHERKLLARTITYDAKITLKSSAVASSHPRDDAASWGRETGIGHHDRLRYACDSESILCLIEMFRLM
jgi:uncharacterized protein YcgI (DUF1989 family)